MTDEAAPVLQQYDPPRIPLPPHDSYHKPLMKMIKQLTKPKAPKVKKISRPHRRKKPTQFY